MFEKYHIKQKAICCWMTKKWVTLKGNSMETQRSRGRGKAECPWLVKGVWMKCMLFCMICIRSLTTSLNSISEDCLDGKSYKVTETWNPSDILMQKSKNRTSIIEAFVIWSHWDNTRFMLYLWNWALFNWDYIKKSLNPFNKENNVSIVNIKEDHDYLQEIRKICITHKRRF